MRLFLLLNLFLLTLFSFGQQTINGTLMHGGVSRSYILYVPASYTAGISAPVVFNFHGFTSNATQQIFYGDFRPIADTAGFLLVVPQGTLNAQGNTYWNAGWGGTIDDVGFTEALLDDLSNTYSINQDRVYSTGMSNGGFMSYHLACNLSNRIAAIASVTGAMTKGSIPTCTPQHSTPVLQIHGDADGTVAYLGGAISESIQDGLDYWINYNNNDTTAVFTAIPDINTSDNSTVEHYLYEDGNNCVEVELYKILNGGHTWPGAAVNTGNGETNHDINASKLIWEFFSKYDLNGKIGCATIGVEDLDQNLFDVKIYPNPTKHSLNVVWKNEKVSTVRLINVLGTEVRTIDAIGFSQIVFPTDKLIKGVYFLEIRNETEVLSTSKVLID